MNAHPNQLKRHTFVFRLTLLACLIAGSGTVRGQVILNPNTITGTVHFSNANPAILNLLESPGNEGMSNVVVVANSIPPAPPIAAYSDGLPATNRTENSYHLTVDSASPGIAYAVAPYTVMQGDQYVYYFGGQTSAPVEIGIAPPPLDFTECVGVVTVHFVTSDGTPVAVDGGNIIAFSLPDYNYTGVRSLIPTRATEQRIFLRGGVTHHLDITVHRGTNFYTDRIETYLGTNVEVTCDALATVNMVFPSAGTLATIVGNVDLVGEFELTSAANPLYNYPDYTTVIANYGPFSNQRWGALPGENFTTPSSGAYTLSNVVPYDLDPFSVGYVLSAQMLIRTNRMIQVFQTPGLGSGANPPLPITAGETVDLTNLFVINPGYLRGSVLLKGPAESLGQSSLLRGVQHAGDNDLDGDGIPDGFGTYGIYWTTIEALGVDRPASGATYTASGGLGYGDFPGDFNPTTSSYEGQYEFALGGLNSESSIWKQKYFNVYLSSGVVTNDSDYYDNLFYLSEDGTNDVEIVSGQPATNDVAYCLSEVKIVFHSSSGTFYGPNVRASNGKFTGPDFLGRDANYSVYVQGMYGTPSTSATASNIGQVVMYLPQGTYQLQPSVTTSDGGAQAGLEPIDVTVGCGQRLTLEPCLQLSLNAPDCTNSQTVLVTGSVRSCTNVTQLSYTLNGGPVQTVCANCGINPSFAFNINLNNECVDNTLIVTATDADGGVSSVTTAVHYDGTPPDITCPGNIQVTSYNTNGAVVNFIVTATDNCGGPVSLISTPPSGSIFLPGTTTVTSVATDSCGNTSSCSFDVIVVPDCLQLTITPPVCTTNYGFLATADATSCDGSLTNLSLRASPVSDPSIRLGYSDIRILIGSRTNLTTAHGLFPEFDGYADHLEYYQDILYTAMALDNQGRVAIVQLVAHYDFTPPVINCPSNIIVTASNGISAVANYAATADDGCPCTVIMSYAPPSGSSFSIGTHTVTVRAWDLCHNTNTCTFQVVVLPPECPLRIELTQSSPPQVTLTWDCDAELQSAPELTGPWDEVMGAASPYVADADQSQTFYRVRYSSAGTALQFPGTSSAYTSTPFPNFFTGTPALTITAWLKTAQSTGAYPGIVTKYLGNSASGYALALNAGRLAPWYYYSATHFVEPGFSGPGDRFVADDLWHHVAFVVDTNSARTFIDGQLVNTQPWTGTPFYAQSSEPLRFGAYPGAAGQPFDGQLDEVTIWSIALTDSEVAALMNTTPQGSEPGLQGYWRFDENGGSTAYDWTGHGYDAVLGSGVGWTTSTAPINH